MTPAIDGRPDRGTVQEEKNEMPLPPELNQPMRSGLSFSHPFTTIAKALVAAQREMGEIIRGNTNPLYAMRYADLASVIEAVHPALGKHGIAVLQAPMTTYRGSSVTVTVETWLLHESGEWACSALDLQPSKPDAQGIGSAITYARRYALLALSGKAPADDDGNLACGKTDEGRPRSSRRQSEQREVLPSIAEAWARVGLITKQCGLSKAQAIAIGKELFGEKRPGQWQAVELDRLHAEIGRRYPTPISTRSDADELPRAS